jgi:hypothetical protein
MSKPQLPEKQPAADQPAEAGAKVLTPAAERALAEAEQRRREQAAAAASSPKEVGGRDGPDPVRYGDWELGGIVSDF